MTTLTGRLADKEVIVVVGPGGVGKTSISAALALEAAKHRKAMVLTIDPAKRLASALGLGGGLEHAESEVDLPGGSAGSLHAAMLDMKTAWDELVDRNAPSQEVAERIRGNKIFQGLSEHFVGSQGYMAMERLADLYDQGAYDVIVVDTPPTRSALDFIEAPKRMTDFIGGSLLRWVAKPYAKAGRFGARAFNLTASPFLKVADRVLGSQVLEDLSEFVLDFQTLYDDFKQRAEDVLALLASEQTAFVVITTLDGPPMRESAFFVDRLTDEGLPLAGVVANRVVPPALGDPVQAADPEALAASSGLDRETIEAALADGQKALEVLGPLARRDTHRLTDLRRRSKAEVAHVPWLVRDVHDIAGLEEVGSYLSSSSGASDGSRGDSPPGSGSSEGEGSTRG